MASLAISSLGVNNSQTANQQDNNMWNGHLSIKIPKLGDKIITVEACSSETVNELKQKIQTLYQFSLETQSLWKEIGSNQFRFLKNSDKLENCQINIKNDVLLLRVIEVFTFQFFVTYNVNRSIKIEAESLQTVLDLKKKIESSIGLSWQDQVLSYEYGQLVNYLRLGELDIPNRSTIRVTHAVRGGSLLTLPFASMESEEKVRLVPATCNWRIVKPGLNLKGNCENRSCKAYNQTVWIPKEFGTFNMNKICVESECPACKEIARRVESCAIYGCIYSFEGRRKPKDPETNAVKICQKDKEAPDREAILFEDGEQALADWYFLEITTRPKPSSVCSIS